MTASEQLAPLLRGLLLADLALARGVAGADDLAHALRAVETSGEDVLVALARATALGEARLGSLRAELEAILRDSGGDPRRALSERGGVDRSLHLALEAVDPDLATRLRQDGVGVRFPLRALPDERYEEFTPVGEGGQGVVYWALDRELGREVAFKVLRPGDGSGGSQVTPAAPGGLEAPESGTLAAREFAKLEARFLQEAWVTSGMDHPGVLPVYELGRTESGVPYYTMRYVRESRTLSDALRDADAGLDARLGLLEPFLKVCDTIAYAHAKGIVHRDLKPSNIALGEFGEVVVLDWGLAKVRGAPDLFAARWKERARELRVPGTLTLPGALGTPGYMAPEATTDDAAELDERSDVYSLGAVLFEILTGRRPFAFDTFDEYAARVTSSEAPNASEVAADVPPELGAVCAAALARDPSARPAGAAALAEAVRAWQTERAAARRRAEVARETRAARLHTLRRGALVVLAFAFGAAIVVFQELSKERSEAEDAQARAEGVMEFMVFELQDELEALGRTDLLAQLADQAEAYYAKLSIEGSTADGLRQRAVALRNLGELRRARGDLPAALDAHRASLAVADALLARDPDDLETRALRVRAAALEGTVLREQGHTADALAVFRSYVDVAEELLEHAPEDPSRAADLARALSLLGHAQVDLERPADALRSHERALSLLESRVEAADERARREAVSARIDLGRALLDLGRMADARARFAEALEVASEHSPDDARWVFLRARARGGLVQLAAMRYEWERVDALVAETLPAIRALRERDPHNRPWAHLHAQLLLRVGDMHGHTPAPEPMEAAYRECESIVRELTSADPSNAYLLNIWITLVDRLAALPGLTAEERTAYRDEAFETAQVLLNRDPDDADWQHIYVYTGFRRFQFSQLDLREAEYVGLLVVADELLAGNPGNFELAVLQQWLRSNVADARISRGADDLALEAIETSLERLRATRDALELPEHSIELGIAQTEERRDGLRERLGLGAAPADEGSEAP